MIRSARTSDAGALATIEVQSWRAAYQGLLPASHLASLDVAARTKWWSTRIRNLDAPSGVYIGERGRDPVGFVSYGPASRRAWGEVYAIYVRPSHWRAGCGGRLLDTALSSLGRSGFTRVELWVIRDNSSARAFYEAMGWRAAVGIRVESIGGVEVNEVRYVHEIGEAPPLFPGLRGR